MTTASDPVHDATNPHAMADDREPAIHEFMRTVEEVVGRTEDLRKLIDEGKYTYEGAFIMVEKQVVRIRSFEWKRKSVIHRNIHEIIKQIIPLLPVDTPDPDDDFTEFKEELERFAGAWFVAPECEMPLWIGLATTLEEQMGEPKADWPDWKRKVLAIFSGAK